MANKKKEAKKNKFQIYQLLILSGIFLPIACSTCTSTALMTFMGSVKHDLGLSLVTTQWLTTGYAIVASSLICLGGQLGDVYGHARLYMLSLIFYLICSLLISISTDTSLIMIGTIFRGLSTALMAPVSMSILVVVFPSNLLKKLLKYWATVCLLGWCIGPFMGGLIASFSTWRILFWINFGVISYSMTILFIYRSSTKTKINGKAIDYLGSFLLISGLATLLLLLSEGPFWGWTSPQNIVLYAVSPVLLILFFISQTKIKNPIVVYKSCKSLKFITGLICCFISTSCVYCLMFFTSYFGQSAIGISASFFFKGVMLLPPASMLIIMSLIIPKLINKFGFKIIMLIGNALIFAGMLILMWLPNDVSYLNLWWRYIIIGTGCGIVFSAAAPLCTQGVAPKDAGVAAGIQWTVGFLGAAIVLTLCSVWYTHAEISIIQNKLAILNLSHDKIIEIIHAIHSHTNTISDALKSLNISINKEVKIVNILNNASTVGFGRVGLLCAICAAIGFIFTLIFIPLKQKIKPKNESKSTIPA